MTAEAIARLRQALEFPDIERVRTDVRVDDLRSLLDAHTFLDQYNFTLQHSLREAQKSRDWHAAQTRVVDALLTEALDVVRRMALDVSADRTWCLLCRTEAPWNLEPDRADRHPHAVSCVLAKAGRR